MNKTFRIVAGVLVSLFFLWLTFRKFNFSALRDIVSQFNAAWIWPALAVTLVAHGLRAFRWHLLLSGTKKTTPYLLFPHLMFGFFMNNVLPARAGEFARSYTLSRTLSLPFSTILGSIALERMSDLLGLATVMILALGALSVHQLPLQTLVITFAAGVTALAVLWVLVTNLKKRVSPDDPGWKGKAVRFFDQLTQSFQSIRSPLLLTGVAFTSICIWLAEASVVCLMARTLQLELNFYQGAATITGISFGVMIPASPGYVGTYEYFGSSTLQLMGFGVDISSTFVVILHIFQIAVCAVLALPMLLRFGVPIKKTQKLVKKEI